MKPGQLAPKDALIDPARLEQLYYSTVPDPDNPKHAVTFGTSGHRGTSLDGSFTDMHVAAIAQAICESRKKDGITGPLYLGMDSHALSPMAQQTALEVLAANDVEVLIQPGQGLTPTPAVSHAILVHNRRRSGGQADGIVVTPSHNPPEWEGIKYNPPNGGPADTGITDGIQRRANELLRGKNNEVRRLSKEATRSAASIHNFDFAELYVNDLHNALDLEIVRSKGVRIGVHPLGGASIGYWDRIQSKYGLSLEVVDRTVDPKFSFMTLDHDGKIRMDCSSEYAMKPLIALKDRFDVAFGNDPDADRHGIVTPGAGLLNPNHFLAIAIDYLLQHRPKWNTAATVGKTIVSSSLIDHVVRGNNRTLYEVPVGFKWFAQGLHEGTLCFGGEESAGASFLARDGTPWSTDKDGLLLGLLAAEITATSGDDLAKYLVRLQDRYLRSVYTRRDSEATPALRNALRRISPATLSLPTLAGDPVISAVDNAQGAKIGGIKVSTANGWFAARPSGTEDIIKLYAESFRDQAHLEAIVTEAKNILTKLQ